MHPIHDYYEIRRGIPSHLPRDLVMEVIQTDYIKKKTIKMQQRSQQLDKEYKITTASMEKRVKARTEEYAREGSLALAAEIQARLPIELRLHIYSYAYVDEKPIPILPSVWSAYDKCVEESFLREYPHVGNVLDTSSSMQPDAFLLDPKNVGAAMAREALEFYYLHNTFDISTGGAGFTKVARLFLEEDRFKLGIVPADLVSKITLRVRLDSPKGAENPNYLAVKVLEALERDELERIRKNVFELSRLARNKRLKMDVIIHTSVGGDCDDHDWMGSIGVRTDELPDDRRFINTLEAIWSTVFSMKEEGKIGTVSNVNSWLGEYTPKDNDATRCFEPDSHAAKFHNKIKNRPGAPVWDPYLKPYKNVISEAPSAPWWHEEDDDTDPSSSWWDGEWWWSGSEAGEIHHPPENFWTTKEARWGIPYWFPSFDKAVCFEELWGYDRALSPRENLLLLVPDHFDSEAEEQRWQQAIDGAFWW